MTAIKNLIRPIWYKLPEPWRQRIRGTHREIVGFHPPHEALEKAAEARRIESLRSAEHHPAPADGPIIGCICRRADFDTDWYATWHGALLGPWRPHEPLWDDDGPRLRRKHWEWCIICQVLAERDMLREGRSGIGFAVGREPLASAFAARGVQVLATDLGAGDANAAAWQATGQHAAELDALHHPSLVDAETFRKLVMFQPADMRDLSSLADARADFIWSSCSMEHLGSLRDGIDFVIESAKMLKPGGVAVHTTEYNCSSNDDTCEDPGTVIYRQRDLEELRRRVTEAGFTLAPIDLDPGDHPMDRRFDVDPYFTDPTRQHVKLRLANYVSTSVLLIVEAPAPAPAPAAS